MGRNENFIDKILDISFIVLLTPFLIMLSGIISLLEFFGLNGNDFTL